MSDNQQNSKAERARIMELYHSDGAYDLVAGAVLLNFGLDLLNQATTTSLFTWIPILLLPSIKNKFAVPRIGLETLKATERQARSWTSITAVNIALGLLAVSMLVLNDPFELANRIHLPWGGDGRNLIYGTVAALYFLVSALTIPLRRCYFYAALALAASLTAMFWLPVAAPVLVTAAVLFGMGIRLTISFNRKYPDPEKESREKEVKKESKKN